MAKGTVLPADGCDKGNAEIQGSVTPVPAPLPTAPMHSLHFLHHWDEGRAKGLGLICVKRREEPA